MRGTRAANGAAIRWIQDHQSAVDGPCLLWPYSKNNKGYGKFWTGSALKLAHREMCERANGPAPSPEHEASHRCGNGRLGCCHPKHLAWKTRTENQHDRFVHGTDNRGEKHYSAKLTASDVRAIRAATQASNSDLAFAYGVKRSTIGAIRRGESWAWLTDNPVNQSI